MGKKISCCSHSHQHDVKWNLFYLKKKEEKKLTRVWGIKKKRGEIM